MGGGKALGGVLGGLGTAGGLALTVAGAPEIGIPLMLGGLGSGVGGLLGGGSGALAGGTAGAGIGMGAEAGGLSSLAGMGSMGQSAANALSSAGMGGPGLEIKNALASNPATAGLSLSSIDPSQFAVAPKPNGGAPGVGAAGTGTGINDPAYRNASLGLNMLGQARSALAPALAQTPPPQAPPMRPPAQSAGADPTAAALAAAPPPLARFLQSIGVG